MATATVTHDFVNGTIIESADVDQNFTDILTFLNASVVHVDGSQAMAAALPMGGFKITGLGTPTTGTDAATKTYADLMLPLAGGTLSGLLTLNAAGVAFPTTTATDMIDDDTMATAAAGILASSESIKAYADLMLPLAGGTMSGAIAMGTSKITGLGDGATGTQDAATVSQLETKRLTIDLAGADGLDVNVTVHEGTVRLYNRSGKARTLLQIHTSVSTAPTGAPLVSSADMDGSTIYTTGPETNAPSIAISAFVSTGGVPEVTAWADGAYLEFNINQIGSTVPGKNLIYTVVYTEVI